VKPPPPSEPKRTSEQSPKRVIPRPITPQLSDPESSRLLNRQQPPPKRASSSKRLEHPDSLHRKEKKDRLKAKIGWSVSSPRAVRLQAADSSSKTGLSITNNSSFKNIFA